MAIDIMQYLRDEIELEEKWLKDEREQRDRFIGNDYPDGFTHYDLGIYEGEPYSYGNATDCYDDGHMWGMRQGRLEAFKDILEKIQLGPSFD